MSKRLGLAIGIPVLLGAAICGQPGAVAQHVNDGGVTSTATPSPLPTATETPVVLSTGQVHVSPAQVAPGGSLSLVATGFFPNAPISVFVSPGVGALSCPCVTDGAGSLRLTFPVASGAVPDIHTVSVSQVLSGPNRWASASTTFAVTAQVPAVASTPQASHVASISSGTASVPAGYPCYRYRSVDGYCVITSIAMAHRPTQMEMVWQKAGDSIWRNGDIAPDGLAVQWDAGSLELIVSAEPGTWDSTCQCMRPHTTTATLNVVYSASS